MLEDEMLPEKYENKEVLWIETEAKHKVWPYSNRSWKRLRRKFTFRDHNLWCFPVYNRGIYRDAESRKVSVVVVLFSSSPKIISVVMAYFIGQIIQN